MAKRRLPISGLQTAVRGKDDKLVNVPSKRPNMKNYTPGEKAPKQPNKLTGMLTATIGPKGIQHFGMLDKKSTERNKPKPRGGK